MNFSLKTVRSNDQRTMFISGLFESALSTSN